MSDSDWIDIDGVDPTTAEFPVAVRAGKEWIVIFKSGEKFQAVGRFCSHKRADLSKQGTVMGGGAMLRCNLHGFVFRLESGKCVNAPGEDIGGYEIAVENDRFRVRKVFEAVVHTDYSP